jgi:hypothetical protein
MLIDCNKLVTLRTWAKQYTRDTHAGHGEQVNKVGCSLSFAHELFNPDNNKPVSKRVREEFTLVHIDGVKFVARISDLPNQTQGGTQ